MTPKQKLFIHEYLGCLNATQAAIRAGYSPDSARQIAHQNLTKHDIREKIEELRQRHVAQSELALQDVLMRLRLELDADIVELFAHDGSILHPADWPLLFRQGLVSSFGYKQTKSEKRGVVTTIGHVNFTSRFPQLMLLGRHLGAFL